MENLGVEKIIRIRVSSEVAEWLEKNKACRERCNVTSKAIEFYYDYLYTRKGFFCRLLELHYDELKHLLRKVGSGKFLWIALI